MADEDHIAAHAHSIWHRGEILASTICGCFYCLKRFTPNQISDWVNEPGDAGYTALCPFCGIDLVIGSASRYAITNDLLRRMNQHWFG
jgi:hypothetical protein